MSESRKNAPTVAENNGRNFKIESPVFRDGSEIPENFTCHGDNHSPPLKWTNVPASAREFALICEDPDAPRNPPFIHWVVYNIKNDVFELPEGISTEDLQTDKFSQGVNSEGNTGYMGPRPPPNTGTHRYYFRLFALDQKMNLPPNLDKDQLEDALTGHIIGEAEIVGRHAHH